jgi:hypothetical protein
MAVKIFCVFSSWLGVGHTMLLVDTLTQRRQDFRDLIVLSLMT